MKKGVKYTEEQRKKYLIANVKDKKCGFIKLKKTVLMI